MEKAKKIIRPIAWICFICGVFLVAFTAYLQYDFSLWYSIRQIIHINMDTIFWFGAITGFLGLVCALSIEDSSAWNTIEEWVEKKK